MNNLLIIGLTTLITIAGGAGYAATTFEAPSFGVTDIGDWQNITEESITVSSKFWINNPNPVGLSLGFIDLEYTAEANNITLARGSINEVNLGTGNNTKTLETELLQENIPQWWVSHLKNRENSTISAPVNVKTPAKSFSTEAFSKNVETNITSRIEKSLSSMEGSYKGPSIQTTRSGITVEVRPELEVRDFKASWGEISSERSQVLMDMKVHNPNSYAVPTPSFGGSASLNNVTMANWTANAEPLTTLAENGMIAPGETEDLRFTVGLKNQKMDEWLESHIERDEYTDADINVHLMFRFEGEEFKVPAGGMSCRIEIQTGILVDNQTQKFKNRGCEPVMESYPNSGGQDAEASSKMRENQTYEGLLG